MDRIEKSLKQFSEKERKLIKSVLERLSTGDVLGLDLQKLKSSGDVYRVRKGDIRIIYLQKGKNIFVLAIERRSEKTYKKF